MPDLLSRIDEMVESGGPHYICFCEAHLCMRAAQEPAIRKILDEASLVLADGVSMTLGCRLLGKRLPSRLPGPVVMLAYCRHSAQKGIKHFFYGGAEGVAEALSQRLQTMIPGLQVAGIITPPSRPLMDTEEADVKKRIEDSGAHVLWVSLGAPKQEKWMAEHVGRIHVPVMLGVGAAFDFHSGYRKWAPAWVRKAGLEWLYRMFTGGKRVFIRNVRYDSLMAYILFRQAIASRINFRRTKKCKR
jgi:N-acetylglucosaminyldiphosphoundecaprenol N-acetyl-beta-D-mannosaminyltransferase